MNDLRFGEDYIENGEIFEHAFIQDPDSDIHYKIKPSEALVALIGAGMLNTEEVQDTAQLKPIKYIEAMKGKDRASVVRSYKDLF